MEHFFSRDEVEVAALGAALDAMTPADRRTAALSLSAKQQAALFEAARGARAIDTSFFVPRELGVMHPVTHAGINSMLAFRAFEKRFCRAPASEGKDELWGYNEQTFRFFTGPGYFVGYDVPDGEVLIDYTRLPPRGAPGWPGVIPNSARLSYFIYNGTQDLMRGVSRHVSIGRASRRGKNLDNWFVLVREE